MIIASAELKELSHEKWQLLYDLEEKTRNNLTSSEEEFMFQLLKYADIILSSEMDLGRTSKLKPRIEKSNKFLGHQAIQRLPPPQCEEAHKLL